VKAKLIPPIITLPLTKLFSKAEDLILPTNSK